MTLLRGTVINLLSDLEKEISRDGLKRLLSVTKDLSGLGERVSLVNDAVERCLVDGQSLRTSPFPTLVRSIGMRLTHAYGMILDDIIAQMDLSQPPVDRSSKGGLEDIGQFDLQSRLRAVI